MANTKGSALTADTSLGDTDSFIIVDYGVSPITTKKVTYSVLEAAVRDATIITDLSTVTAAAGDFLLVLDVSASPQALKKVLVSDLLDNATHTGDVTGSSALTIQPVAISGKGAVTASGSDYVLILDTSTSPHSLKKALVSDLGSAFGVSDITGAGAFTVAGGDLLVGVDISASPQVLGQATAQAIANLKVTELSEDISPELGGNLAAGGNNITDLGDVTFKTGAAGGTLRTGTSAADKFQLQAYDVDGAAYVTLLEADAGNTVRLQLPVNYLDLEDATDTTKIARLSSASITTGTTRTYTFPDKSGTFAMTSDVTGVDWSTTQTSDLSATTGDEVAFDLSSTVNKATSGNYTGIKLDVTETSAPGSDDRLIDLKVGGASKFAVNNAGSILFGGTTASVSESSGNLILNADAANDYLAFRLANSSKAAISSLGLIASGIPMGFGANVLTADAMFHRDAAANIAQRNSTTAQTFRVYNTYTDASNYERLAITGSAITVETAGTGTDDIDLTLTPAGAGVVKFGTHSAIGAETVTGYITIKDAGGTSRKLAVVS